VGLTGLPRLEPYLKRIHTSDEHTALSATVVSIDYDERNIYVLAILDDSRPDKGLIIPAKIRMYRDLFEQKGDLRLPYRVGDTAYTSVRIRNDATTRDPVPKLTSREITALKRVGVSSNQAQHLCCNERLSLEACNKLIRVAETPGLANALRELYCRSNELLGDRIITDLEQRFPAGKHVKGTVTYISGGGVKLALKDGAVGHVARDEITWWNQRTRLEEFVEVGDVREGKVLHVDVGLQTVHLSFRKVLADSWQEAIEKKYPLSKGVEGIVQRIQPFGAFVMLEPGLDGLIPLAGMRAFHGRYVERAEDVVRVGDRVRVRVDRIDSLRQKISLVLVARLGRAPVVRKSAQTEEASTVVEDLNGPIEPLGWDDPVWPWTEGENAITEQKRPEPPPRPKPLKRVPLEKRPNPLSWTLTW
jgi:predicted RNA-binding protein with RPS1 domain